MISIEFYVAIPRFKIIQKLVDRLNLVTREILTGLMVIRAFNSQKYQEAKFDNTNRDLTRTTLFINCILVVMMPGMMLIMNGVMLAVLWFGAHRVDHCFAGQHRRGLVSQYGSTGVEYGDLVQQLRRSLPGYRSEQEQV